MRSPSTQLSIFIPFKIGHIVKIYNLSPIITPLLFTFPFSLCCLIVIIDRLLLHAREKKICRGAMDDLLVLILTSLSSYDAPHHEKKIAFAFLQLREREQLTHKMHQTFTFLAHSFISS